MNYSKVLVDLYKMKQNTKMSAKQMKRLQNEKLRKLLCFAWEHSQYYRQAFESAGITEEQLSTLPLSSFPTIDKKLLGAIISYILLEVQGSLDILSMIKKPGIRCFLELYGGLYGICP